MSRTPDELRHAIDRGATGEKVSFPDPAAAPLGTDEEAAGTPIPKDAARTAYRNEVDRKKQRVPEGSEPAFPWTLLLVVVLVLSLIAFIGLQR